MTEELNDFEPVDQELDDDEPDAFAGTLADGLDDEPEEDRPRVLPSGAVDLKCGHWTEAGPIATFSTGRKLYDCPVGCGMQERVA